MPRPVVRRAVAERHGDAEIGLQIAAEEQPDAAARRCQRRAVGWTPAVPPDEPAFDEAVELEAGQVFIGKLLVVAQLQQAGDTVVAADLGGAIAAAEGKTAEIELLRQVHRARSHLAGGGKLQGEGVVQRLVAGEPEIQRREFWRGAPYRGEWVALVG